MLKTRLTFKIWLGIFGLTMVYSPSESQDIGTVTGAGDSGQRRISIKDTEDES